MTYCHTHYRFWDAAMIYGDSETDLALDQKRQEVEERLARETRIGWSTLTAIAALLIAGAVIVAYLFLNAGVSH
jgi:hypothetical protein